MARTVIQWADIRKAEVDPEELLARELARKLAALSASALRDEALAALTTGGIDAFMQVLGWASLVNDWQDIAIILQRSARKAGVPALQQAVASAFSAPTPIAGTLDIAFDVVDRNVVAYSQNRAAHLVVEISEEIRDVIRAEVTVAVNGGLTTQQVARRIARIIPLHSRYARAVVNFEERTLRNLIKGGMDPYRAWARAAELSDRYAAKLVRTRSKTIARTEVMTASNAGQFIGQSAAFGTGTQTNVFKEWVTAEDEDVCPVCGPLHGTKVPFTEPFTTGKLHPPAHPNCRCSYNIINDYADRVAEAYGFVDGVDY